MAAVTKPAPKVLNTRSRDAKPATGAKRSGPVSTVQTELSRRGSYKGKVDGVYGKGTKAAVLKEQQDHNARVKTESQTGLVDREKDANGKVIRQTQRTAEEQQAYLKDNLVAEDGIVGDQFMKKVLDPTNKGVVAAGGVDGGITDEGLAQRATQQKFTERFGPNAGAAVRKAMDSGAITADNGDAKLTAVGTHLTPDGHLVTEGKEATAWPKASDMSEADWAARLTPNGDKNPTPGTDVKPVSEPTGPKPDAAVGNTQQPTNQAGGTPEPTRAITEGQKAQLENGTKATLDLAGLGATAADGALSLEKGKEYSGGMYNKLNAMRAGYSPSDEIEGVQRGLKAYVAADTTDYTKDFNVATKNAWTGTTGEAKDTAFANYKVGKAIPGYLDHHAPEVETVVKQLMADESAGSFGAKHSQDIFWNSLSIKDQDALRKSRTLGQLVDGTKADRDAVAVHNAYQKWLREAALREIGIQQ